MNKLALFLAFPFVAFLFILLVVLWLILMPFLLVFIWLMIPFGSYGVDLKTGKKEFRIPGNIKINL